MRSDEEAFFIRKGGAASFLYISVTIIVLLDVVPFCQHALVILYFHFGLPDIFIQ